MAIIKSAITKLNVTTLLCTTLLIPLSANAGTGVIHDNLGRAEPGRAVSSLQVENFVKTKYKNKGSGIGLRKFPKPGFPDCYVARLMDHEGTITIIKINCK